MSDVTQNLVIANLVLTAVLLLALGTTMFYLYKERKRLIACVQSVTKCMDL